MNELQRKALELKRRYTSYGQHTGSRYALDAARKGCADLPRKFDWDFSTRSGVLQEAHFMDGKWDVFVEIRYEECPDLSWIGDFSNRWKPGCIEVEKDEQYNAPRHGYTYFHPATEYRNLDWRLMKQIVSEDLIPSYLAVRVERNGHELGSSRNGGGFYEPGKEDDYAMDYVDDCIEEAMEEAEAELADLCLA